MTDTLDTIMRLGERLQDLKDQLDGKETEVSELKEQIRQLEEVDIPQLMDERGLEEMRLRSGKRIKVGDFIQARIKHTKEAFQWLGGTNNDGIIKNGIKVSLDRGKDEREEMIKEDLRTRGVLFDHKQTVHPSTLKSFVTEALNNPDLRDQLPREAFGVYAARKVTFR